MKSTCALLALNSLILVGLQPQIANATTLYNGSGLPEAQGWLAPGAIRSNGNPIFPLSPYQTIESNGIKIQTNNIDDSSTFAGYFGYSNYVPSFANLGQLELVNSFFPNLNANQGYSIFFDLAVNSLPENNQDRAAFSLIAISSDVAKGIELDFEQDLIFAQSDTPDSTGISEFKRAETSSEIDTSVIKSYELRVSNNSYQLFVNSDSSPILTGNLRDYEFDSNNSDPNLPFNPYETANFLFLGDLSDQAGGTFTLGSVRIESAKVSTSEFDSILALALIGFSITTSQLYINRKA